MVLVVLTGVVQWWCQGRMDGRQVEWLDKLEMSEMRSGDPKPAADLGQGASLSEDDGKMGGLAPGSLRSEWPWCSGPVGVPGATCDLTCYVLFYVWCWEHGDVAVELPGGRVVRIEDGKNPPLDLCEQPWYVEEIGIV